MAEGGCFCGAVRYQIEGPPLHADYCHCRMCQRVAGAPVVAWGTWPADRFTWKQGEPKSFASSAKGERSFCPSCGTPLTCLDRTNRSLIDVTLASLDDPAAFPPQSHARTMSRIPWLEIADGLPRYASTKSDGESGGS